MIQVKYSNVITR